MDQPVIIAPLQGVNGYKFGKSPQDIALEFGAPDTQQEDDILEMVFEQREGMEFEYHKKGRKFLLAAITIPKKAHADVRVKDKNIFACLEQAPSELSPDFLSGQKYLFYGSLGVSIAGYSRKKPKGGPYVIAFSKASYEHFELDGLKP